VPSNYAHYRDAHPPRASERPIDGGMVAVAYASVLLVVAVVLAFGLFAFLRFGGWW
jgi:4-hydroxybenzoate polyprenyltransferase